MLIGAHVPNAEPLEAAAARHADAVQMFLSNPQSWKPPLPRRDAAELRDSEVVLYVHGPYLINVASPNNRVRIPSRKMLTECCDAAAEVGAAAVIVHGGHVSDDEPVEAGFGRWRKALESIDTDVPILIENTAAGGNAVAREVEMIGKLWEEIGDLGPGFCLDTCHAWAAGEELATIVDRVREATGRIDLVHCNDSRDAFGSRRDRHTNLGTGEIPPEQLVAVAAAAGATVIVETPGDAAAQEADIAWLRERL